MTIYTVLNMLPALAAAHSNCILQLQSLCKVKVLFRQPKKPAAWDKPRGRSPTRTSPQTVPGAQPTGQGWLRLLRAPWEHPHTPLGGSRCPQTELPTSLEVFACGSRPHACIMLVTRCWGKRGDVYLELAKALPEATVICAALEVRQHPSGLKLYKHR